MPDFKFINASELADRIGESTLQVVDIRDPGSFSNGRIKGAQRLDNSNLQSFIASAKLDAPLVVCCYHGNSSQSAAALFASKGFTEVYSLDGGFEMWRNLYPEYVES